MTAREIWRHTILILGDNLFLMYVANPNCYSCFHDNSFCNKFSDYYGVTISVLLFQCAFHPLPLCLKE